MTVVIIVTSPRPYRPLNLWSTLSGSGGVNEPPPAKSREF